MTTFYFDMDGTIANFYGVENWLEYLQNEDTTPYAMAKPLLNLSLLARLLNKLQKNGYGVGIISWGSKNATDEYLNAIEQTKKEWLAKHLKSVHFDEIHVIPYGEPKEQYANGNDVLFDDEYPNRKAWLDKGAMACEEYKIIETLKYYLTF